MCYWEIGKFLRMSLKANPNCLECLFSGKIEHIDAWGRELKNIRKAFVSKRIIQTFGGYSRQQLHRFKFGVEEGKPPKWKQAMHMLRLVTSCADSLEAGYIKVHVGDRRDQLLGIRDGGYSIKTIMGWYEKEEERLQEIAKNTSVPDLPDFDTVEKYLTKVRLWNLRPESYDAIDSRPTFLDHSGAFINSNNPVSSSDDTEGA